MEQSLICPKCQNSNGVTDFFCRVCGFKLKEKLLESGFPAYVEGVPGGYRVRVGRFKSQDEALNLSNKLSKEGFPTKLCP